MTLDTAPETAAPPPRLDLIGSLWRAGNSRITLLALLLLLCGALSLAAFFPQMPSGLAPAAAQRWLTTTSAAYGVGGTTLAALGVFQVTSGVWLRILLAALAYVLALRAARQMAHVWRVRGGMPEAPARVAPRRYTLPGTLEQVSRRVLAGLEQRYCVQTAGTADEMRVYARRGRGLYAPLMAYLGPLLLIAGLLVDGAAGWHGDSARVATGDTAQLPRGALLQLENVAGAEANAAAAVALHTAGGDGGRAVARAAMPGRIGNMWIALRGTGLSLAVNGQDAAGAPLPLQGEEAETAAPSLSLLFTERLSEHAFTIARPPLVFRAVSYPSLPERGIQSPVFLVEAYRGEGGEPVASQIVEQEGTVAIDGVTLALRRERFALLDVAYLPGLPLWLAGALLTTVGLWLLAWAERSECWLWLQRRAGGTAALAYLVSSRDAADRARELQALLAPEAFDGA